jgi:hypothetical protein
LKPPDAPRSHLFRCFAGLLLASLGPACASPPPPAVAPRVDPADDRSGFERLFVPSKAQPEPVVIRSARNGLSRPQVRGTPIDVAALPRAVPLTASRDKQLYDGDARQRWVELNADAGRRLHESGCECRTARSSWNDLRVPQTQACRTLPPAATHWLTLARQDQDQLGFVLAEGSFRVDPCSFNESSRLRVSPHRVSDDLPIYAFRGCGRACGARETLGLIFPAATRLIADAEQFSSALHVTPFSAAILNLDRPGGSVMAMVKKSAAVAFERMIDGREPHQADLDDEIVPPRFVSVEVTASERGELSATLFVGDT